MLVYGGPVVRAATLDAAKQMGVDAIRVQFVWRNIALQKPRDASDPAAYGDAWSNWDSLVIEARKRGLKVLATDRPAPTWAAGTTDKYYSGSRYPSSKAFGQFVAAVGRRYSGQSKSSAVASSAGLCSTARRCRRSSPAARMATRWSGRPAPAAPAGQPGRRSQPPPPNSGPGDQCRHHRQAPATERRPRRRIRRFRASTCGRAHCSTSPQRHKGVLRAEAFMRGSTARLEVARPDGPPPRSTILIGETLPIGSNANRKTATTSPIAFARELFCLNGSGPAHPGCSKRFCRSCARERLGDPPSTPQDQPFSRPPGRQT